MFSPVVKSGKTPPSRGSTPTEYSLRAAASSSLDRSGSVRIENERDRDIGLQALRRGYAAVCLEQRCFGERSIPDGRFQSMCHEAGASALVAGRTLVGDRVLDVARLMDVLATRGGLDTRSPGIIGNSAGGTTAYYALAALPELGWGIPSCCFGPIAETRMRGHFCTCSYVPNHLRLCDMPDLAALIAPPPLTIVSGEQDGGFPPDAVRSGFTTVREHYHRFGTEEHCALVLESEGHRWYARSAWTAARRVLAAAR
jgi:dienelactone hydrolase